jgi:EpsI family protein
MLRLNTKTAPALAIALLLASYVWYDREAARVHAVLGGMLPLQKPLSELPLTLGDWKGKEVPLDEAVVEASGTDDRVNRLYYNRRARQALTLYVCYYGKPRTMAGHYPERCYTSTGWEMKLDRIETLRTTDARGHPGHPVVVNQFEKGPKKITVISFYDVGGSYTADRDLARRKSHRAITTHNRNYLAQVWITIDGHPPSDHVFRVVGDFLNQLLPMLERHLPSAEGNRTRAPGERY